MFCVLSGKLCRSKKVFLHTDAAQAVGKIPVDVDAMNIDLMSISGHKIYGPKGMCITGRCMHGQVKFDTHCFPFFFLSVCSCL